MRKLRQKERGESARRMEKEAEKEGKGEGKGAPSRKEREGKEWWKRKEMQKLRGKKSEG